MKGYVGGLDASASILAAYLTSREFGLCQATDDLVKLHGLWVLVSLETRAHELLRPIFVPSIGRCAKVRRQG